MKAWQNIHNLSNMVWGGLFGWIAGSGTGAVANFLSGNNDSEKDLRKITTPIGMAAGAMIGNRQGSHALNPEVLEQEVKSRVKEKLLEKNIAENEKAAEVMIAMHDFGEIEGKFGFFRNALNVVVTAGAYLAGALMVGIPLAKNFSKKQFGEAKPNNVDESEILNSSDSEGLRSKTFLKDTVPEFVGISVAGTTMAMGANYFLDAPTGEYIEQEADKHLGLIAQRIAGTNPSMSK